MNIVAPNMVTLYAEGASLSQVARAVGVSKKTVTRAVQRAGIMRTKSEGKLVQYRPVTTTRGGELVLKLSWVTIRTPYLPIATW